VEIYFDSNTLSKKCYVEQTSAKEIKCRLDSQKTQQATDKGKMIAFLKTYEEANCTLANKCVFSFTATVPDVTTMTQQWDSSSQRWLIHLSGTGFTGTAAQTELYIGSKRQDTSSVTATDALIQVTDAPSEKFDNMVVYWDVGLGTGNNIVGGTVNLTPKLVSVSPNQASAGGAIVNLNIQGVGKQT